MKKIVNYFLLLMLQILVSCQVSESIIEKHVKINIYEYESDGEKKGSGMPEIKSSSNLKKYRWRFEYLLLNVPEIHQPANTRARNEIFSLYPDKSELKKRYLQELSADKKLVVYFYDALAPINDPDLETKINYTKSELMEVASKFFYCDLVLPDTVVQAHVCIGLNGVKEANWEKDYILLAAFCYEAIFTDFENESSEIWNSFVAKKLEAGEKYKATITSFDQYLLDVRHDLFERMKNDEILKNSLLSYYELNKSNLAFRIVD